MADLFADALIGRGEGIDPSTLEIAVIITDAIGSIAKEVGDFVTEGIEMREAARISRREERQRTADEPLINLDGIEDGDLQG